MESVKELTSKNFDNFIKSGVVVVEFGADWCNPCKIMKPIYHEVANMVKSVKFGTVDVDKENELAQRFEVRSVPTIIYFKSGKQIDSEIGVISKNDLLKKVKENIK